MELEALARDEFHSGESVEKEGSGSSPKELPTLTGL